MTNLDWAKLGFMTAGISRDGQVRGIPLLGEEGWLRHQENAAKPPLKAQTGWSLTHHVSKALSPT
ncbi:MAG: hypothetical protein DMG11_03150 [Acidobacteria bacterium]|nr:MAG: hypothetical protein DMG11_03150 [Acidobacteriota bacterium]